MQAEILKYVPDVAKLADLSMVENALNATRELVELNGKVMGRCLENQIGLANLCVEGGEKQVKIATNVTDPQDFTVKQKELYEEYAEKLSAVAEDGIKFVQETGEEYAAWFKRNIPAVEQARVKTKPVKAVKKAAA